VGLTEWAESLVQGYTRNPVHIILLGCVEILHFCPILLVVHFFVDTGYFILVFHVTDHLIHFVCLSYLQFSHKFLHIPLVNTTALECFEACF